MSWLDNLTGCWEGVSTAVLSSCRQWLPELAAEEVVLGTRHFRMIRMIGEGGYSFVFLVRETTIDGDSAASDYALKKVRCSTPGISQLKQNARRLLSGDQHADSAGMRGDCNRASADGGDVRICCALQVQAASPDQLQAARFEIAVMSRLRHPNLLPLLASQISAAPEGGPAKHVAYMLFPLYAGGSLADLAERLTAEGRSLPASEVIHIFVQVK